MSVVPIVFCADANFGQYITVALQSIIENSSNDNEYHIIIFDCGLKSEDIAILEQQIAHYNNFTLITKDINKWLTQHKDILIGKSTWTPAMYGRIIIPEICSEYPKVIYADVDMIFNRDLAELMRLDLSSYHIAAVKDVVIEESRKKIPSGEKYIEQQLKLSIDEYYFNSGFLVFNISLWRRIKLSQNIINFLKVNKKLKRPDQDALNFACKGKVKYLSQDWNDTGRGSGYYDKDGGFAKKIIHYVGRIKPWHSQAVRFADIWWHYAAKTAVYDRLLKNTIPNLTGLILDKESCFYYKLLNMPLLRCRFKTVNSIRYYLFNTKRNHIAETKIDKKKNKKSFYLLGLKLYTRTIKPNHYF